MDISEKTAPKNQPLFASIVNRKVIMLESVKISISNQKIKKICKLKIQTFATNVKKSVILLEIVLTIKNLLNATNVNNKDIWLKIAHKMNFNLASYAIKQVIPMKIVNIILVLNVKKKDIY